jgi:GNAT superfamily N-acetyltransferase
VVAWAGAVPVSSGRVTFLHGSEFAGLWGGGTLPGWRGRGIFKTLVAHRARLAAERGFTYLQVDATDDSRPILHRAGFTELTTTTPFVHAGV